MRLVRYTYPNYRSLGSAVRSPWAGLETEIDRLFETTLRDFSSASPNQFPIDLYEDADRTYVRAELPGVTREDIGVEVAEGYLTISAARKTAGADSNQPEQTSAFSRAIAIGDDVDAEKVGAAYENGVLTITLPKREEAKPKKITVAVK